MAHAWKACWVQALGGSNPPSSATGPRDLLRFRGFCCLSRRWCSGRRRARPLCVPLGGGPPASRPRRELRSARRLEARPGPAAAHRHRGRSLRRPPRRRHLCRLGKPGQAPPPPTGTAAGPSGALYTGGTCDAVRIGRQSGGPELLSPGLVLLRLRGLRRSLHPGAQPGPRPSQRASSGAGPSRCSSIRPRTPSR